MKLRHVRIKNFRCFSDVQMPVDDSTILIGENNSGKPRMRDLPLPRLLSRRVELKTEAA